MVDRREAPWVRDSGITERYLKGKKGIIIDSYIAVGYFSEYVARLGGKARIAELVSDDLLDTVESEGIDFLIVHNYVVGDKDVLLQIRKMGVEMLLLTRGFVAPEQKEEHTQMCDELKELGVSFGTSTGISRVRGPKRFLKRVYGQESSD